LQAGKKRGRGSLQTEKGGGGSGTWQRQQLLRQWNRRPFTCVAVKAKQSQRRDGRTGVGTAAAAAAINAWQQSLQRKKPALGLLLALLGCSRVPSPESRLTSVHNSPFWFDSIRFDLSFVSYWRNLQNEKEWKMKWSWKALLQSPQVWEQISINSPHFYIWFSACGN
jgi:hypothetical protein